MARQQAGSAAYQDEHFGKIFEDGFSFSGFERDKLFVNDGTGRFVDLSDVCGADDPNDGRAAVVFDVDDDGDQDLFVHNVARARHRLYRNETLRPVSGSGDGATGATGESSPGFVKVRLRGTAGAPDAAGAVVRLASDGRVAAQVLALGSGFISQSAPELVFGLGARPAGELSVTWPGGVVESFGRVQAGARVLLVEGRGAPAPFPSRTFALRDPPPAGLKLDLGDVLGRVPVADVTGTESEFDLTSDGETWLTFWASWCVGCRAEMDELDQLDGEAGRRVVAVCVDVPEDREKAAAMLEDRGVGYTNVFLGPALIETVVDVDRLALPTTLVLGADGTVQRIVRGPVGR